MNKTDLAIVGAGPTGLSAALVAARAGLKVWVFDDNALPGGQYFRQLPKQFRKTRKTVYDKEHGRASELFTAIHHPNITYLPNATVWENPDPGILAFTAGERSGRIEAKAILIACGASDRPVPFPGWTLPGVVTAGGLQNLVKGARVVPGERAVVAGNGPLLLVVAANLIRAGATVAAVAEAAPATARLWRNLPRLLQAPEIVKLAINYRGLMAKAGVPYRCGETVIEARGHDELEEVVLAPIGTRGRFDRAKARTVACDTLVTGFGLNPSIEMYRLLGCDISYNSYRGGWMPKRSEDLETSIPGIFAAGDGAGIGGVEFALIEGRLAGTVIARNLGGLDERTAAIQAAPLRSRLERFRKFRVGLERVYAPPSTWTELATEDTIVCRCEDVSLGDIRAREAQGFTSAFAIKGSTRMSMGRCQGRNCLPTLAALIAARDGLAVEQVELPQGRPPARLVTIGDLLQEDLPAPVFPTDPHLPRGEEVL